MSNNKTVTLDYDEYQMLLRFKDHNTFMLFNGGCRAAYKGKDALLATLETKFYSLQEEYSERIKHATYVSSRLTKLENRNWFERLFNIDI